MRLPAHRGEAAESVAALAEWGNGAEAEARDGGGSGVRAHLEGAEASIAAGSGRGIGEGACVPPSTDCR